MSEEEFFPIYDDNFKSPFREKPKKPIYKIYNDGGHYIATRRYASNQKRKSYKCKDEIDVFFEDCYSVAKQEGLKGDKMRFFIKDGMKSRYEDCENLDKYIEENIDRKAHNLYARKKRFRRKAYMNKWNYMVTFTYDGKKHSEETFRKRLRKCLSNLHTRHKWRYMYVFERAPETNRLHFHGLFYIPDEEMVGNLEEKRDYSTEHGEMQVRCENDFFEKRFGRNDFKELNEDELRNGQTLDYLLKYIDKTDEKIVYSRGVAEVIYRELEEADILTEMQDYCVKYVLFDDVIVWERDVMNFRYEQILIDELLNKPRRELTLTI